MPITSSTGNAVGRAACAIGLLGLVLTVAPAQILDTTFDPNANSDVLALAVQPDGKILVGGSFTRIANSSTRSYLARLNPNGTIDSTFNAQLNAPVYAIVRQSDGKLLIGGAFTAVAGVPRGRLVRLTANGALDPDFAPEVGSGIVRAVLVQPDDRIVVGGSFVTVGGVARQCMARLFPTGALDPDFSADLTGFPTFTTVTAVGLARQSDGAILIGGQFVSVKGQTRPCLCRVTAAGDFDASFDASISTVASVSTVVVSSDGKIFVGGSFLSAGQQSRPYLARLNANGSADTTFSASANRPVFTVVEAGAGKFLVGGLFSAIGGSPHSYLARLNADGTLDTDFAFEASGTISTSGIAVQAILPTSDGRILIGGNFSTLSGSTRNGLARLVPPAPAFTLQPASTTAAAGSTATLSATVVGLAPAYQWRKNGVALVGATNATLTLAGVQATDAGSYDVVATNSYGSVTSSAATLTVTVPPTITAQPSPAVAVAGQPVTFKVAADSTPAPTFQWQKDGANIAGATAATYTIAATKAADAGSYRCVVSNGGSGVTSAAASLVVLPRARLANVSVRTTLATAQTVIVGFVVSGGMGDVLMRAAGPALASFGISAPMADPRIELYHESTKLLENDNWPAVLTGAFTTVGAFPFPVNSLDAAMRQTLSGAHSAVVGGAGAGVVLVEVYDVGNVPEGPRLVNLSARNRVGSGDDVLIAGFAVGGYGSLRVLIRAVGPTLGGVPFNVPDTLNDPKLELYDAGGVKVLENDNWDPALASVFTTIGAFGLAPGGKDAAMVAPLAGGNSYTAVVKGADGGTGVAIVEIYELP